MAAQSAIAARDGYFVTSDGVRLHYLEAGRATRHTILFVPGWTMPAWIWAPQIAGLLARTTTSWRSIRAARATSDVPATGYEPGRRGQDIAELIAHLEPVPVVVVGWSLGVLDTLAYVHTNGDALIAGLVLVDNSVGEEPPPMPPRRRRTAAPAPPHAVAMRRFVQGMFHRPQSAAYLDRLTEATLHTPEFASRALLAYPVPRTYWREAIYSTAKPVLYVVRPRLRGAGREPAAQPAQHRDRGVRRRRPRAVRR